jgi:hypothetical protein
MLRLKQRTMPSMLYWQSATTLPKVATRRLKAAIYASLTGGGLGRYSNSGSKQRLDPVAAVPKHVDVTPTMAPAVLQSCFKLHVAVGRTTAR